MILEDGHDVLGLKNIIGILRDGGVQFQRLLFEELIRSTKKLYNEETHYNLRRDLIEHLWELKRNNVGT
jgi:hypothetical protein